jgi:hypothetical protein
VEPQALIAGPEQRDQLTGVRGPDVPGRCERPPLWAKPIREGTELADRFAASCRSGQFLPVRQAHRELGEFPLLARGGSAELPLQRTPQQILIGHQPAFLDIGQEGGQRLGIADVHAAVQGGHHYCLRHPVPLLVADRFSELLRGRIDGGLVLLDGRAPRVAQPVSVQVAQQGPQRLRRVQQILLGGRDLRRNPFQQRLAYLRWGPVAEPPVRAEVPRIKQRLGQRKRHRQAIRLGPGLAPPEQQLTGSEVGIGLLDLVTGTHRSTLATGHASDHALRDLVSGLTS